MAVRVLLVLAALSMLAACGEAAQEQDKPQPETTQSQERTSDALKYGDPVELVGIPWSEPQRIDYEGRQIIMVVFVYAEGPGAEKGEHFAGIASAYGGEATKELKAAGMDAMQASLPEYRLQGKYEGWITLDDDTEYETLNVEHAYRR